MKNLIAKLKTMNYKQFALQHGEKVALGIGVFCTLLVLWGGVQHAMGRYTKTPLEFTDAATKAKKQVETSPWSEAEKKKTDLVKFQQIAENKLLASVRVQDFEYDKPMSPKLYPRDEPISEPNFLAIEDIVATSGSFVMATALAPPGSQDEQPAEMPAEEEAMDEEETAKKPKPKVEKKSTAKKEETTTSEEPSRARGVKFIVVRGVFPFRQQMLNLQKALNLETLAQATEYFEIVDFNIRRQKALKGADPWTGPWKDVSLETALEFLSEADDFDQEIVREEYTSTIITSPLPARITGAWTPDFVSHPQLESFLLSEEERAKKLEENRKLMEQATAQGAEITTTKRGGFSSKVVDKNKLISDVQKAEKANTAGNRPAGRPGMAADSSAGPTVSGAAKMLLFRFFDVSVEPGECYRYQVQLILKNPNFGASLDSVKDASVALGETRVTSWSEPSPPAVVQSDVDYFLARGKRIKGTLKTGAELDVYQWDPQVGTLIAAKLKTLPGQVVGGRAKAERLNVAKPSLVEEPVTFTSKELFVDSAGPPVVDIGTFETDNPDLGVSRSDWTKLMEERGALDMAVTVNPSGELQLFDRGASASSAKKRAKKRLDDERKEFSSLKDADDSSTPRNRLDTSKYDKNADDKNKKAKSRERNPLRMGAPTPAGKPGGRP